MKLPQVGPAFLVTAAFIGPGTVITASLAGTHFGYSLIWALLFSVIATIILQEMTARLGIVTQQGLGENIRSSFQQPLLRAISILLVVSAIVVGNAAYQSGNISGASLGLSGLLELQLSGSSDLSLWPLIIGVVAFILLWSGSYKIVEKALILLVCIMSLAFLTTFIITQPDLSELFSGLLIPSMPDGSTLTIIALIGTTVVPYNLFLHSASVKQKWQSPDDLPEATKDLFISIPLGGLISIAIVSTAAAAFFGKQVTIQSAADLAPALEPVFGELAKTFMAIGLFAAGISSAVTAPLASAYALSGILNLKNNLDTIEFKAIWIIILISGVVVSSIGYKPISIIWFAQVANGILLPIICAFLLWIMNSEKLGSHRNSAMQNILGLAVLAVTLILSGRSLMLAFGWL
ncbi:Nramp family divalent metal transporter [Aliikangiella coralliicola]|uniref:Divalent metal cation transporter n=1 Tax=Aliikangiella coralliicola TaxID=2592383 RepID=A0A545UK18_9GAMM|nr:Nramp family divalent metal transporter [Aliikangiella coralliicola]TQV89810.1 divalent metal cation transporter [Aliikangiella coralliicola]